MSSLWEAEVAPNLGMRCQSGVVAEAVPSPGTSNLLVEVLVGQNHGMRCQSGAAVVRSPLMSNLLVEALVGQNHGMNSL